jgi:hypothetical protein
LENPFDEGVIRFLFAQALRSRQILGAFHLDPDDRLDDRGQIIDAYELGRPQVNRGGNEVFTVGDYVDAFDSVLDIHETPSPHPVDERLHSPFRPIFLAKHLG